MFSRIWTKPYTKSCSEQIERLKAALQDCDAVVIGAGAGLSTSAGFVYTGERFEKYFSDFAAKYGIQDMYSGGFFPFATPEEHWAYWSRYIYINRYMDAPKPVYDDLLKLVQDAAKVFAAEGFDVEIVEKHHNQKLDAPSGTALALADSINEAMGNPYEYVYDRSQRRQKRDKKELGISAVRGGTIVGDHDVIFAGKDEVITFSHTAYSKAVFGKGAVAAAKFLKGKTAGRYEMADVIAAN